MIRNNHLATNSSLTSFQSGSTIFVIRGVSPKHFPLSQLNLFLILFLDHDTNFDCIALRFQVRVQVSAEVNEAKDLECRAQVSDLNPKPKPKTQTQNPIFPIVSALSSVQKRRPLLDGA